MKLILEPTPKLEAVEGVPCRVWVGQTESGIPVHAYIRMVSPQTHDAEANALFDRELKALPKMERQLVSFDWRLVI